MDRWGREEKFQLPKKFFCNPDWNLVFHDVRHTSVAGSMKVLRKVHGSNHETGWHREFFELEIKIRPWQNLFFCRGFLIFSAELRRFFICKSHRLWRKSKKFLRQKILKSYRSQVKFYRILQRQSKFWKSWKNLRHIVFCWNLSKSKKILGDILFWDSSQNFVSPARMEKWKSARKNFLQITLRKKSASCWKNIKVRE